MFSGVHFAVGLSQHTSFPSTVKFDKIITNVGGGYIDGSSNSDHGKFIAPENGTYQFSATFYNDTMTVGADLKKNGQLVIVGHTCFSIILDLKEKDEVFLVRSTWVPGLAEYNHFATSFSGFLILTGA